MVDARGFQPEGTDPELCLAAFLARAHDRGWRRFVLHHVRGQRLLSTAVMGRGDTDDVVIDIHGPPGVQGRRRPDLRPRQDGHVRRRRAPDNPGTAPVHPTRRAIR